MKYFLWFLMCIALVVVTFVLILHLFKGNGAPKQVTAPLISYANTDATVELTQYGPVVADQQHQGYRITVGNTLSQIDTLQGYQNTITSTATYPNNQEGYAEFLRALDLAGFQKSIKNTSADSRGYCATGDTYLLEIVKGGQDVQRLWYTSCKLGTFKGNLPQVLNLFQRQIPGFSSTTSDISL